MITNKTFTKPEEKTMEQVQAEVNALTHLGLMDRISTYLFHAGSFGCSPYYIGGILTPNGMMMRALCDRLTRMNDVDRANVFLKEAASRDAQMKKDAEDAKAATPEAPKLFWIDSESMVKAAEEVSTTKALLTTYPVSGCVPVRTLNPEELKQLETTEL